MSILSRCKDKVDLARVLSTTKGHYMGFPLPKGLRYQQFIGQREVQNILPLLIPTNIPKPSVHPLETYISHTHMAVEISLREKGFVGTTRFLGTAGVGAAPTVGVLGP
jgi:hypothetical protein